MREFCIESNPFAFGDVCFEAFSRCRIDVFRLFTSLSRSDLLKQRVFSILSAVLRDLINRYQSNLAVMKSVVSFAD